MILLHVFLALSQINSDHEDQFKFPNISKGSNRLNAFTNKRSGTLSRKLIKDGESWQKNGFYSVSALDFSFSQKDQWTQTTSTIDGDYYKQTSTPGAKASYKFYGTYVSVFARKFQDAGNIKIYIDENFQAEIPTAHNSAESVQDIWRKSGLTSGFHTIELECANAKAIKLFAILVRPGSDSENYYKNICSISDKSGLHATGQCSTTAAYHRNWWEGNSGYATFNFLGNRFWLTGTVDPNHLNGAIIIDGENAGPIIECRSEIRFIGCLLYQSEELEFKTHTVKIECPPKFELADLIYVHSVSNEKQYELFDNYQVIPPKYMHLSNSKKKIWLANEIDRSDWNPTANSECITVQNTEGPINYIKDDNQNTRWHSAYYTEIISKQFDNRISKAHPHYFYINLGKKTTFKAFSYQPRTDQFFNGRFETYEFYIANNLTELMENMRNSKYIAKGIFNRSSKETDLVILPFPHTAQFVALQNLNHDKFGSCAEFRLYADPTPNIAYFNERDDYNSYEGYRLSRGGWIASATSYENEHQSNNEGPVKFILDENTGSIWHSCYENCGYGNSNDHGPFTLTFNMQGLKNFTAFSLMPRQGQNGRAMHYEFYIADNEGDLTTSIENEDYISKGDVDLKTNYSMLVTFYKPVSAQWIALKLYSNDQFGSAAEFNLYSNLKTITPCEKPSSSYFHESIDTFYAPFKLNRAGWKIIDTTEDNKYPVSNILDGNANTMWRSSSSNQFIIDLGKETTFNAFSYTRYPYSNQSEGAFPNYELFTAYTKEDLNSKIQQNQTINKGNIDNQFSLTLIVPLSETITARFIALRSTKTNKGSCAEFNLYAFLPQPTPSFVTSALHEAAQTFWNDYKISRSSWKTRANSISDRPDDQKVHQITDDDFSTFWQSLYTSYTFDTTGSEDRPKEADPFELTFELGDETTFKAFSYTPKIDAADEEKFKDYEFYSGNTPEEMYMKIQNKNYIAKGKFEYKDGVKSHIVIFRELQSARFVALLSLNHEGKGTCSDFSLYTSPPEPTADQRPMTDQTNLLNLTCDKFTYENWADAGQCVEQGSNQGSFSLESGSKAKINFSGVKFYLLSHKTNESGYGYIYLNGTIVGFLDFRSNANESTIIYTSEDLPYDNYEVMIESVSSFRIEFGSLYINPLPSENSFCLTRADFVSEHQWTLDETAIPPVFTSNEDGAIGTFTFLGTRCYLTGVRSNEAGNFEISLDGTTHEVNENKAAVVAQNNRAVVLFDSGVIDFKSHTLTIRSTSTSKISIMNLFYIWYPHLYSPSCYFTLSDEFSKSVTFSSSADFTKTQLFTSSTGFSTSISFTSSNEFSNSISFTSSDDFSTSISFTSSNDFSTSISFTSSNEFSNSISFTSSNDFSNSVSFTVSSDFSKSVEFTDSNLFEPSSYFTNSIEFTSTVGFSQSSSFTISTEFSKSQQFTLSEQFTTTIRITKTDDSSIIDTNDDSSISSNIDNPDIAPGGDTEVSNKSNKVPMIIGIVFGILAVLAIIIALIILFVVKKNRKREEPTNEEEMQQNTASSVSKMFYFPDQNEENGSFDMNTDVVDPFDLIATTQQENEENILIE